MAKDRKIGVAMDFSDGSKLALKWAMENFLEKGDTLFLVHVKSFEGHETRNHIWSKTGSPLIPYHEFHESAVIHGYGVQIDNEVMHILENINKSEVTVFGKVYWGDPREKICEAVANLKLDALVMGCRGLGSIQRVLLGSVTSYVVENATCPVTVIKNPSSFH